MRAGRDGVGRVTLAVAAVVILVVSGLASMDLGGSSPAKHSRSSQNAGGSSIGATVGGTATPSSTSNTQLEPAASTPAWTNITSLSAHPPPPRDSAGMVYDSTDGYLLLFGGEQTNPGPIRYYNDTWKFADGQWTNITTPKAPSARFGFQFADDPADGAVVLFGGIGAAHVDMNNTWEFKAGTWTNVTSGTSPPERFWGSMSYDIANGRCPVVRRKPRPQPFVLQRYVVLPRGSLDPAHAHGPPSRPGRPEPGRRRRRPRGRDVRRSGRDRLRQRHLDLRHRNLGAGDRPGWTRMPAPAPGWPMTPPLRRW